MSEEQKLTCKESGCKKYPKCLKYRITVNFRNAVNPDDILVCNDFYAINTALTITSDQREKVIRLCTILLSVNTEKIEDLIEKWTDMEYIAKQLFEELEG